MKQKIFVLVVTLMICLSAIVIIPNDYKVEATGGGGGDGGDDGIGLDYDYIWNRTKEFTDVMK